MPLTTGKKAVLIGETDPLIALDLAERLMDAGFDIVGPVFSHRELDNLAGLPLAAAVLNAGALGPDISVALKPLTQSGVPVLLISGYDDIDRYISGEGVVVLPKPTDLHDIVHALGEAISRRNAAARESSSPDKPNTP